MGRNRPRCQRVPIVLLCRSRAAQRLAFQPAGMPHVSSSARGRAEPRGKQSQEAARPRQGPQARHWRDPAGRLRSASRHRRSRRQRRPARPAITDVERRDRSIGQPRQEKSEYEQPDRAVNAAKGSKQHMKSAFAVRRAGPAALRGGLRSR